MSKMNRWLALWIASCLFLSSFVSVQAGEIDKTKSAPKNVHLSIHYFYQKPLIALDELRLELPLSYQYSESEGTLTIWHAGQTYELLRGTTIIARNGIHLPLNARPYIERKKK